MPQVGYGGGVPASLLINVSPTETRVALLEDGRPVEVYIDRDRDKGCAGNIYLGKVVRVLPGMQAAFVEVGLERTGFLYVNDAVLTGSPTEGEAAPRPPRGKPVANIADVVSQGQEVLVQVEKEPLGTKGARLSRHLSLPGRYLVFLPFTDHVGVSTRIEDDAERERLREVVAGLAPAGAGFIIRTAAEGVEPDALVRDAEILIRLWRDVEARSAKGAVPRLVFEDLDISLRLTRDLFSQHLREVVVDHAATAERLRSFIGSFATTEETRVVLYGDSEPLFERYGVEAHIQRALQPRVPLPSGGSVVIEEAEALTVVDVNSGRYVGESSLEETITQINLEAVEEVAHQLRFRNIGGIIIIDLIDMNEEANREKVLAALEEHLRRDKVKTTVVRMSELGLVEMTRKRVRDSLGRALSESCPYCEGRGVVKSLATLSAEMLRSVKGTLADHRGARVVLHVAPELAAHVREAQRRHVEALEGQYGAEIAVVEEAGAHRERWRLVVESKA